MLNTESQRFQIQYDDSSKNPLSIDLIVDEDRIKIILYKTTPEVQALITRNTQLSNQYDITFDDNQVLLT